VLAWYLRTALALNTTHLVKELIMSDDNLVSYLEQINGLEVKKHQVFCLSDVFVREISESLDSGSLSLDRGE
jgi:hypothetical protein